MEAIDYITSWTGYLATLIIAGSGLSITYLFFKKSQAVNDGVIYDCNKKIKNTLIGAAIGLSITGFIEIFKRFF